MMNVANFALSLGVRHFFDIEEVIRSRQVLEITLMTAVHSVFL